nr:hypothetical protein [Tanacetum cinerariifolium]
MSDDDATGAESPPRGVDSYYRPGNFEDPSPIVYPAAANGAVSNFKIQPNLIAILPAFRGHEEPYAHLREFFSITDTYQVNNTTKDGVRLCLFPFSLKDQAKAWFTSLEPANLERQMGQLAEEVHTREADVPKPPTQNPEATESPKDGEGGVSSTTTPYPEALEKSASARLAKKDLCTQKRKLKATFPKKINLTEHVSAVLSSSLAPKFKDPGAPLISVVVGNITIKKALLDLRASINILPASLVDKGILEDVIVKVDDFYYPFDLFVMDTESPYKDVQLNIILGRPFLATIDSRINCRTGAMDIAFGNRKLQLNVFNLFNSPISNDCYHIDTIDECIQTHTLSMNLDHTLEKLHYVDSEKELFDGMTFHEKEEEFQMTEEEFLLSLEETPLQSQQVQQPTLNEV